MSTSIEDNWKEWKEWKSLCIHCICAMPVLVKPEHIAKGIATYKGQRNLDLEVLLKNGNLAAEVFVFDDKRCLVKYLFLKKAFLYDSEEDLLNTLVLS